MNDNKKSLDTLHDLIETCEDGKKGYQDASEHIENDELKTILYRLSQQRSLFEEELKNEVLHLGGDTDEKSSVTGTAHRVWINIKSGIRGNDTEAILKECKRGDKAAIEKYEEALKAELPDYIREKVSEQFNLIKGAYNQLTEFQEHPE